MKKLSIILIIILGMLFTVEAKIRQNRNAGIEKSEIYYHMDNIKNNAEY